MKAWGCHTAAPYWWRKIMPEQENNKDQQTAIVSAQSTRRTRIWIIGAAIFTIAVIIMLFFVLTRKTDAERLEEALSLGEKYLTELDYEQAIASYRAAIEIDPKCVDAYIGLADTYIAMGDYEEAKNVLNQAEEIFSGRMDEGEDVAADLERIRKKIEELEALFKQKREKEAEEKLSLAEQHLFASEYINAVELFTELLELTPDKLLAYFGGVDACLHLDRRQDAVTLLENGMVAMDYENFPQVLEAVNKSTLEGYIGLAEAFEAEGLHERAIELLERVYRETGDEIIGRKLGIVEASEIKFREDYVITWQDQEFERLIREYLGKETGEIHYDEVKEIESIEIFAEIIVKPGEKSNWSCSDNFFRMGNGVEGTRTGKIHTLKDLEHFTGLKDLSVNYQENLDISALAETETIDCLMRLENLVLIGDELQDISAVSDLSALKSISIMFNHIVDISPLAMLIELENIQIGYNIQLISTEPLKGLRKLYSVGLSGIAHVDLEIFVNLPELKDIHLVNVWDVDYNVLLKLNLESLEISCDDKTFPIIRKLKTLKKLRLHGYGAWDEEMQTSLMLTNIEGIGELTNLEKLDLLTPGCYDISPISSLEIETLEIQLAQDCDLTPLKELKNLKKVIVPDYELDSEGKNLWLEKVKNLLPNIEVTDSRY